MENTADKKSMDKERVINVLRYAGAGLFAIGLLAPLGKTAELIIFLAAYALIGWQVLLHAAKNLVKGKVFDENFLMSIATIGAFAIGQYAEGVAVMLFYQVGEAFQELASDRSKRSISDLMELRSDYANLATEQGECKVAAEEVVPGDIIIVKPGERVPLDGKVAEGVSAFDTSALTGESLPRDTAPGDEALAGYVNISGLLKIEVTTPYEQSTVAKILDLVQNSGARKAVSEKFITKFARYYTPFVVISALLIALLPPLAGGADFGVWFRRALVFLVISCPCALVLSIPLSYFGGIGGAAKKGVLIKGGNYLEALNKADTLVLDKTGTLTKGAFTLKSARARHPYGENELLHYAAHAEYNSLHPLAACIRRAYSGEIDRGAISDYTEIAGQGISATIDGKRILAGNDKLMKAHDIAFEETGQADSAVHIAVEGNYAGHLLIGDEIKPNAKQALDGLREQGIKRLVMLTGDNALAGESVAGEVGITEYYSQLLPHQKVEAVERIAREGGGKLIFAGDGINDAPVLARADIGIAMGGIGSDAALEAADIVLMTDDLSKISAALSIARKTRAIVIQNIAFSLFVKALLLILGALGRINLWWAVFGDVGVSVLAVFNAMRAGIKVNKDNTARISDNTITG
ncbi:MAG: heavy metal translocating P-type ATPase [Christensenellales bacterium]|jgi:Cd2+/Zn2+-exporting ATPase